MAASTTNDRDSVIFDLKLRRCLVSYLSRFCFSASDGRHWRWRGVARLSSAGDKIVAGPLARLHIVPEVSASQGPKSNAVLRRRRREHRF